MCVGWFCCTVEPDVLPSLPVLAPFGTVHPLTLFKFLLPVTFLQNFHRQFNTKRRSDVQFWLWPSLTSSRSHSAYVVRMTRLSFSRFVNGKFDQIDWSIWLFFFHSIPFSWILHRFFFSFFWIQFHFRSKTEGRWPFWKRKHTQAAGGCAIQFYTQHQTIRALTVSKLWLDLEWKIRINFIPIDLFSALLPVFFILLLLSQSRTHLSQVTLDRIVWFLFIFLKSYSGKRFPCPTLGVRAYKPRIDKNG